MRYTKNILMTIFIIGIAAVVLITVLFETDVIEAGQAEGHEKAEFVAATTMELLTMALIWMALRLFKMEKVSRDLTERRAPALANWGILRLAMLDVPMVINILLYELFLNSTFAYLTVLLLICQIFVCPTLSRCEAETALKTN